MSRMMVGVIFLVLSLISSSCSSTSGVKRSPNLRFVDLTFAKGVNQQTVPAAPINSSVSFSSTDEEIVALLRLQNLSGKHMLKWDWYSPDATLYFSTGNHSIQAVDGKYHKEITAWHRISIRGERAAKLTGVWVVNIFLDNELTVSRKFTLE